MPQRMWFFLEVLHVLSHFASSETLGLKMGMGFSEKV